MVVEYSRVTGALLGGRVVVLRRISRDRGQGDAAHAAHRRAGSRSPPAGGHELSSPDTAVRLTAAPVTTPTSIDRSSRRRSVTITRQASSMGLMLIPYRGVT